MPTLDQQIADLEHKIQELRLEKARLDRLPPTTRLAEVLHDLNCRVSHEDQCGWMYESWDKPGSTRKQYLAMAEEVRKVIPLHTEEIVTFAETLRDVLRNSWHYLDIKGK